MQTYTVEQIEQDIPQGKKMTRAQLIDYLLDEMNSFNLKRSLEAEAKLKVLCPKRK